MKSTSAVPLYTGCDDDGLSFIVAPQIRTKKNENCDAHLFISVNPRARETTPVIRTLKGNEKQFELSG